MTTTRKDLLKFKKRFGLRDDWHEPDEQEISAKITGLNFDNAMGEAIAGQEITVVLYYDHGEEGGGKTEELRINLANLLAMATTPWVHNLSNLGIVERVEDDE